MRNLLIAAGATFTAAVFAQQPGTDPSTADRRSYLAEISKLCQIDWPKNRTVNIACHGHSVPSGYFKTPEVHTFEAYPYLLHAALAERFPHAVINVIVTAMGGKTQKEVRGGSRARC
jgi:acyl-CoA thioesterase-1